MSTTLMRLNRDMDGEMEPDENGMWVYADEAQPAIDALQARIVELEKDAARLEWVIPILQGNLDAVSDDRANWLCNQVLNGKTGREMIDAAIEGSK